MTNMGYQAVRTDTYKYVHYLDLKGMDELYDLKRDPYELKNVIGEAGMGKTTKELDARRLSLAHF